MDSLAKGAAKIDLSTESGLEDVLSKSEFSIFSQVKDLGYFTWRLEGSSKKIFNVSTSDIQNGLDYHGMPSQVVPIDVLQKKCPRSFAKKKSKGWNNEFPYDPSYLVPLHVALTQRKLREEDVDFLFGGSTLNMLATQQISGCEYLAQKVPGTQILIVQKCHHYRQNLTDHGYQFERLVCGGEFRDEGDSTTAHHLQAMTIGGRHKVLFSAECDGIDEEGNPVEIKCSNPKNWSTKVAFQMISNGSLSLYAGSKNKTSLTSVKKLHVLKVMKTGIPQKKRLKQLEENILSGLRVLSEAIESGDFEHGRIMNLSFKKGRLTLHPHSLLPPESVIGDLLSNAKSAPDDAATASRKERPSSNRNPNAAFAQHPRPDPDWDRLRHLPDEMVIGMGYIPEDFCGFGSD